MKDTSALISLLIRLRPILMRIVPNSVLRRAKARIVRREAQKMGVTSVAPFERAQNPDGINLFGSVRAQSGLGQSCRLVADAITAANVPLAIVNYEPLGTARDGEACRGQEAPEPRYNINILHINPPELPLAFAQFGKRAWDARYNIAYWLWELEEFPEEWRTCFNILDEVWTPSEFISECIRKTTDKPVFTVPYPISAPYDDSFSRRHFDLPEDVFLFLCMYDQSSISQRKNPLGAIGAFKRAFSPGEGAGMIVKASNAAPADVALIRKELKDYPNVFIINELLPKLEANSLIRCADAYVSLHRAEGFGLVAAEAMLLGTPVIATGWSANTEFMDDASAMIVEYELVRIEKDVGPYKAGNRWAEPDLASAARHMRKLYEDRTFAAELADRASAHVARRLSMDAATEPIRERIGEILSKSAAARGG